MGDISYIKKSFKKNRYNLSGFMGRRGEYRSSIINY